jgi:hypothetical protein
MKQRITMVSFQHRAYPYKPLVNIYRSKKSRTWHVNEEQAERITETINGLIEAELVSVSLQTDGWFITVPHPLPIAKTPLQKPIGCDSCNYTGYVESFDWVPMPFGNGNCRMPSSEPCMYCNPDGVE